MANGSISLSFAVRIRRDYIIWYDVIRELTSYHVAEWVMSSTTPHARLTLDFSPVNVFYFLSSSHEFEMTFLPIVAESQ